MLIEERLKQIARKLRTYAGIYTGDKEARAMADDCEREATVRANVRAGITLRDAHRFGFHAACGPANEAEAKDDQQREEESWQDFLIQTAVWTHVRAEPIHPSKYDMTSNAWEDR